MESISNVISSGLNNPVACVALIFLVAVAIYWNGARRYTIMNKLGIPGPKPLPYIGNCLDIIRAGSIVKYQMECMKKYGKIFAFWTPNLAIVVADPEIRKEITVKQFNNFRNRYIFFRGASRKSRESVFSARDDTWKRIRNTLTPTFSAAKMKLMVPLMDKATDTLMKKLQFITDTGRSVDMREWFSQMTMDVILMTSFAMDSDVQSNPDNKYLKDAHTLLRTHTPLFLFFAIIPFGRRLFKWIAYVRALLFPNSPLRVFEKLAEKAIFTRQEQLKKGVTGRKDLLYLMLTAHVSDGVRKLSREEISAQCVSFLFAGFETTSTLLTNIFYNLSMNSIIQEKLREEIESAMQNNKDMGLYDLANNIEYLDCVVKEALRLFPMNHSIINRECCSSCTINGVFFPAGVEVALPATLPHRDPDAWPDGPKFDPERHRGPAKELYHQFQLVPFGSGQRNCIGMRFALLEAKLTTVKLMRKFRFLCAPDTPKEASRDGAVNLLVAAL